MQLYRHFEALTAHVRTLQVANSFKQHLIQRLEYLKTQSLCDQDRRDKFQVIRQAWNELQREASKVKAFEKFQSDQEFWNPIEVFVGDAAPLPQKQRDSVVQLDPYAKWDAVHLLHHLELKTQERPVLEHSEWLALTIGIMFLHSQSHLPRMSQERNRKNIKFVYESIRPLLVKSKLLLPFRKHENLQMRWKAFINGSIV